MIALRRIDGGIRVRTESGAVVTLDEKSARELMDVDAQLEESAARRKLIADKIAAFPIEEHALDLLACGGPDLRPEAEALANLLQDFARRMRNA